MNRNQSSRLGDQQAEGNLGNERNRGPAGGSGRERMRNRSSEDVSSGDSVSSRRSSGEASSTDEWSSGDSESGASRRSSR